MIRPALLSEREQLLDVWLRSASATHEFVSAGDIKAMIPQVREYFASRESGFWVLCDDDGRTVVGFMGLLGDEIESLFVVPEFQRRGGGRRMVEFVKAMHPQLFVEVNEQNKPARAFYRACGFEVVGCQPVDRQGRPYPLLQMRWSTDG
jgi:putative acetyltransferase